MVTNEDAARLISAIKMSSTYDFSDYSDKSFCRRIEKILLDNNMDLNQLILKIGKAGLVTHGGRIVGLAGERIDGAATGKGCRANGL